MENSLQDENANKVFENIELALPVNAAYVSAAKQTAFSVAGRLGFDAQEADDIKTAVSEACVYIIKRQGTGTYKITFSMSSDHIHIRLGCPSEKRVEPTNGDYSLPLIKSLMDSVDILDGEGVFEIVMSKKQGEGG